MIEAMLVKDSARNAGRGILEEASSKRDPGGGESTNPVGEKLWRRNPRRGMYPMGILEEEFWNLNSGRGIPEEESRGRNLGRGILEEESWRRNPREVILEEPWRRNPERGA